MMKGSTRPDGDLRTLLSVGSIGALPDGALLDLFEGRPGDSTADRAFAALVERHGALVLRVARGRLASEEDACDAFQATFWLLARRSRSIRNRDALAGWLFGVASRVATRLAVEAARRRVRERQAALPLEDSTFDPSRRDPDLAPALTAEVARLPAKYRLAVILCDLEGFSADEAATRLGCPVGTFKARLSRARAHLRTRLAHRGFAPADWRSAPPQPSVVPLALIQAACRVALSTAPSAGPPAAAVTSALLLAQGASRTMLLSKFSVWAATATLFVVAVTEAYQGFEVRAQTPDKLKASPAPPRPAAADQGDKKLPPLVAQALRGGIEAAESNPDITGSIHDLIRVGRSMTTQGDHTSATAAFRKARAAIDMADADIRVWGRNPILWLAQSLMRNDDRILAHETFGHAMDLIQAMPPDQFARSWGELITVQIQMEGRLAAQPNMERVRRLIGDHKADFHPAGTADHFLIQLQAMTGDFGGALASVANFPIRLGTDPSDDKAQLLIELAGTVLRGDGAAADGVFDAARQAIMEQKQPLVKVRNLVALIDILAKLDRSDAAWPLIALVDSALVDPKVAEEVMREYSIALDGMIHRQLGRNDFTAAKRSALHVVEVLSLHRLQPREDLYAKGAALVFAVMGEDDSFRQLMDRLPTDNDRYECIWTLPIALRFYKKDAEARGYEDQAIALTRKNIEIAPKTLNGKQRTMEAVLWANWSNRLANLYAIRGDVDRSLQAIETLPLEDQQNALGWIGRLLARSGYLDQALEMTQRTTDRNTRREIAVSVAIGLPKPDRSTLFDFED